ncbi:MAG: PilZ domain-containing protein [Bauldia sp.]
MKPPAAQNCGPEQRRERRVRVLKSGRIIFNGGYTVFDCRVRNLSTGGAMLEMPSLLGIPRQFDLVIDIGQRHPCTVMWRTNTLMGVAFDDAERKG